KRANKSSARKGSRATFELIVEHLAKTCERCRSGRVRCGTLCAGSSPWSGQFLEAFSRLLVGPDIDFRQSTPPVGMFPDSSRDIGLLLLGQDVFRRRDGERA